MIRATLRGVASRRLRLVLSGLAVVLGVMFVSGALVLTDTLGRSFEAVFADVYAATELQVRATPPRDDSEVPAPTTVPAGAVARVAAVPGVATATGLVSEDGARLVGADGKVVTTFGGRPRLGTNWIGETGLTRLRSGRGPARPDEVAISAGLARAAGVAVGDRVGVLTLRPRHEVTVVGILEYGDHLDSLGGAHEIAFHGSVAAEEMLGGTAVFSAIDVRARPGTDAAAVRARLATALGPGYEVRTGAELRQEQAASAKDDLGFVNGILLGFAGIVLFVGVFLILNTFSVVTAQRTREFALLRALGAGRGQVIGSVLLEAVLVGAVASAAGLALGLGAGAVLARLVNRLGRGALDVTGFGAPPVAVLAPLAVGIGVTAVAALLPALRASRVPPVAALRDAAAPDRPLTRLTVAGTVTAAAGGALLVLGLAGGPDDLSVGPVLGGVLVSLIGAALLTPVVARPAVSLIGGVFARSVPGRLGRLNSARNPRRTAITASALMVGIALVTGLNIVLTSATDSLEAAAPREVTADLLVTWAAATERPPTFDRALLARMRSTAGVETVVGRYHDSVTIDGRPTRVTAVDDPAALPSVTRVGLAAGSFALHPDELLVDTGTAAGRGLRVGSTVRVGFPRGPARPMTVAGLYTGDWSTGWVLPGSAVGGLRVHDPSEAFLRLAPDARAGARVAEVRHRVGALLAGDPEIIVTDPAGLMKVATAGFGTVLLAVQGLLGLAMLTAVLGIVNTLALSVLERTRELGLLRAVGLSRAQARRMVAVEAVVISTFGALLGVVVGTGLGVVVVRALAGNGVDRLALPWAFLGGYLLAGAAVGVLAAVLPAIRAARIDVLRALAYE